MAHKATRCALPLPQRAIGPQGFVTAAHNVKLAMSAIAAVRATT